MGDAITADDIEDFRAFCESASDAQLPHIIEKEASAGRRVYADVAKAELRARERCASHR